VTEAARAPTTLAGPWRTATVGDVAHPSPYGVRLRLAVPERVAHVPGQHYVVRLTAPDGYVAQRSYSAASDPADPELELYVERLADGEVSPYLVDEVRVGDRLEVRGPIGGWFVWDGVAPMLGIGGGSGVVPLVAMLRHAARLGRGHLVSLAAGASTFSRLPYGEELLAAGALVALSQEEQPQRPKGRLRADELAPLLAGRERYFVCGSAGFAEALSTALVALGVDAAQIRIERFGPSG